MNATEFYVRMGRPPIDDDLERVNCPLAATLGHWCCGLCPGHGIPMFACPECFLASSHLGREDHHHELAPKVEVEFQ